MDLYCYQPTPPASLMDYPVGPHQLQNGSSGVGGIGGIVNNTNVYFNNIYTNGVANNNNTSNNNNSSNHYNHHSNSDSSSVTTTTTTATNFGDCIGLERGFDFYSDRVTKRAF
ncbi:PREDICTED: putative transcriptional regulator cudA [Bactrocera latifrons]|uniref:putative transcriptional regulator cudA n=1 Tax=Bactrocera latifrons TaxID=174628 RepID=UPI0008DD07A9|nr:PREDICTED: putative transcriptional regulator cudA [Bactrocera latifrons]